jgi:hypothetical protein
VVEQRLQDTGPTSLITAAKCHSPWEWQRTHDIPATPLCYRVLCCLLLLVQAGAGLVADSVPESEYEETLNKAAALGRAIDLAEQAFVQAACE